MGGVDRRSVLLGTLGGLAVGAPAGVLAERGGADPNEKRAHRSYAQQGEDLVIAQLFYQFRIPVPSYIDIGAHDPVIGSNTYLFYARGSRGLLVEPNPTYAAKLRSVRPGDQVLEAGIGFEAGVVQADYYLFRGDGQINTFSKEQADAVVKKEGRDALLRVVKMPLVNINQVLAEHFPQRAPDLFSVDTEGLDLPILRALDFARFRPRVVCAETSGMDGLIIQDIVELMRAKGYTVRGGSFVNSIFLDDHLFDGPSVPPTKSG